MCKSKGFIVLLTLGESSEDYRTVLLRSAVEFWSCNIQCSTCIPILTEGSNQCGLRVNFLISSKQFAYQKTGDQQVCLGFLRSAVVCPVQQCWSEALHYNQTPTVVPNTRALNPKIKMLYLQISSRTSSKSSSSPIITPFSAHSLTTKNADYLANDHLSTVTVLVRASRGI